MPTIGCDSLLTPASSHKDNISIVPDLNNPLQPKLEDSEDDLEIVEQSELDHFIAVLQNAQIIAAKAEREWKPEKHPNKFEGKSKRTQRQHKKHQEDLMKQGYLLVFDFITHTKEKAS